jgi:hypothetical protein
MSVSADYIYGNGTTIKGRKTWKRPQAMLWADAAPTISGSKLIPVGYEIGSDLTSIPLADQEDTFLILSDHNRDALEMSTERIEQRQRMANGTMRSYHIADKLTISTSWSMLPSRGFKVVPNFNQDTGKPGVLTPDDLDDPNDSTDLPTIDTYFAHKSEQYTADGGAGGGEMLDWYENHTGPFWVLLSYDKYNNFGDNNAARTRLSEYSDAKQMYISSFTYSVVKRGGANFDMWDVSVTLEEV